MAEINRCESCGPMLEPVYPHDGTDWCAACMRTEGWPIPSVHFSSGKDDWETPDELFNTYNNLFNFTLDAAADASNHKCPTWFGPGGVVEDALEADWSGYLAGGNIWLNPPYSRGLQGRFVRKAAESVQAVGEDAHVVCLLPARTDTKLFHEIIQPLGEVTFLKGRVKFVGAANGAPFPSMIVVF